jgi:hypothetical protein
MVGGTFFLAILARNLGKQLEPGLWESWGGSPTIQLLRHAGTGNPILRERWHRFLSRLLGKPLPTPQEEQVDSKGADDIYNAGIKLLINKTRDVKKFHLLYKENIQYGYCRNLFAMRTMGLILSGLGSGACLAAGLWNAHTGDVKLYVLLRSACVAPKSGAPAGFRQLRMAGCGKRVESGNCRVNRSPLPRWLAENSKGATFPGLSARRRRVAGGP